MQKASSSRSVRLTVFSSISNIGPALLQATQKSSSNIPIDIIEDPNALSGYGGTIEFHPNKLSQSTLSRLSTAETLVTEPAILMQLLQQHPHCLDNLRWCQSTYAGVDPLFANNNDNNNSNNNKKIDLTSLPFVLTRFAGKFGPPIAEWCLARIIGNERNFALTSKDQVNMEWAGSKDKVTNYRYLSDLTLTILGGAGDIGRCIGRVAKLGFGMRVIAHGKTPRSTPPNDDDGSMDEYTTDLIHALQQADYLISVLPSTPETRGMLSYDILSQIKPGAVFINVGRGDIFPPQNEESTLIRALDSGILSAAILDVFATEPLPKESPLWKREDVVISPHVSGLTRGEDVPDIVLGNYHRYVNGEPLLYQVDWSKGY